MVSSAQSLEWFRDDLLAGMKPDARLEIYQTKVSRPSSRVEPDTKV
jgi:hypothetical protein